jgi:hypothetical protein
MTLWQFLSNPETAAPLITILTGLLGLDAWRKKRASTAAEIDRWASTAAGAVVMTIRLGLFKDDEDAVTDFLKRFKQLATIAGVEVDPKHEIRALLIGKEAVTKAGTASMQIELNKLKGAADAMVLNMERLAKLL